MDGEELRRRRSALGLSKAELGRLLDVEQNTVYRWEKGDLLFRHPAMLDKALRWLELQKLQNLL
jgi:transcriptional regulator with XRE-family HTH domain